MTLNVPRRLRECVPWFRTVLTLTAIATLAAYALHDMGEPYAYGHTRWGDAYTYLFANMHFDHGFGVTRFLNTWGYTPEGGPIYYLSGSPVGSLSVAALVALFGPQLWTAQVLPFIATVATAFILWAIARQMMDRRFAWIAPFVYCSLPLVLKYSSHNAGKLPIAIALGLLGVLFHIHYLKKRDSALLGWAALMFSGATMYNWHGGLFALVSLLHAAAFLENRQQALRCIAIYSAAVGIVVALVLLHQGLVTGDASYPLRRALERSEMTTSTMQISLRELLSVQGRRLIAYFGIPVLFLFGAWAAIAVLDRQQRAPRRDMWIALLVLTAFPYGLLLTSAAYAHDYLLLPLVPAAALAAAAGASSLNALKYKNIRAIGLVALVLACAAQATLGVQAAMYFETREREDFQSGEALAANYMAGVPGDETMLLVDSSSGYAKMKLSNGVRAAVVRPHIDYLVRRPAYFVASADDLETAIELALERDLHPVIVQEDWEKRNGIVVPSEMVEREVNIGLVRVVFLRSQ